MEFKPKKVSEATCVAECYYRLRLKNIPCALEYKKDNCRFDMVILNQKRNVIIAIVEFKNKRKKEIKKSKQYYKYLNYNLPLLYYTKLGQMDDLVKKITVIYKNKKT